MTEIALNRRTLVVSGAAALATIGLATHGEVAALVVQSGGGIAGGGSLQIADGPAEFTVFGSRFQLEEQEAPVFTGSLSYNDVVGKTIVESTLIDAYGPVEGNEATMRQMSGFATVNGQGKHPFNLVLTDGGPIGAGLDHFKLEVGADGATEVSNPAIQVDSTVQAGGLTLIEFNFGSSAASPTPAG